MLHDRAEKENAAGDVMEELDARQEKEDTHQAGLDVLWEKDNTRPTGLTVEAMGILDEKWLEMSKSLDLPEELVWDGPGGDPEDEVKGD